MRPPRADIALPPLPPELEWAGDGPKRIEQLSARGPVLVAFIEIGEPSAVRTLPYLETWHRRYHGHGLSVVGVHTPRLPIATATPQLARGLARLGVSFPVANDRELRLWRDYGCSGWPSTFLWRSGGALAWTHFGEGEYVATDSEIRRLLAGGTQPPGLPEPIEPVRPEDAPGAPVRIPSEPLAPAGEGSPWTAPAGEQLELRYSAGSAYATADGEGTIAVSLDGRPAGELAVEAPGAYELIAHRRHESHQLGLAPSPGVRIWSIGFGAGLAR